MIYHMTSISHECFNHGWLPLVAMVPFKKFQDQMLGNALRTLDAGAASKLMSLGNEMPTRRLGTQNRGWLVNKLYKGKTIEGWVLFLRKR